MRNSFRKCDVCYKVDIDNEDYDESNVMGRMGCTFPVGFVCDKGPATTAIPREKIKYMLCRMCNNETRQFTVVLHSRLLDNIFLYSDLQI